MAQCRNDSTVTLFSQNENTLFSLWLSDEGDNILYQTKDRKKAVKKEALLACHIGRWSTLLNVMALSSAPQRRIYVAYPDCNKGIRPLVNGYISPRIATSGKMPDIYVLWSRDGCLDNTPKASFQTNHFVFLTNKFNENLPQGQSINGENASMPSLPFERETHRIPKCPVPEEGELFRAPEKKQKSKQLKINDMFKKRKEDVCFNRSLNSCSSRDEVMNHFAEKKMSDAEPSKPFSPEVHNICKESFSLLGKIAQEIIKPDDEMKHILIKNRVPPESLSFPLKVYKDKQKKAGVRWRCCQHQWFTQFEFICYNEKEDGMFCLACLLFPVKSTPGGRAKNSHHAGVQ